MGVAVGSGEGVVGAGVGSTAGVAVRIGVSVDAAERPDVDVGMAVLVGGTDVNTGAVVGAAMFATVGVAPDVADSRVDVGLVVVSSLQADVERATSTTSSATANGRNSLSPVLS